MPRTDQHKMAAALAAQQRDHVFRHADVALFDRLLSPRDNFLRLGRRTEEVEQCRLVRLKPRRRHSVENCGGAACVARGVEILRERRARLVAQQLVLRVQCFDAGHCFPIRVGAAQVDCIDAGAGIEARADGVQYRQGGHDHARWHLRHLRPGQTEPFGVLLQSHDGVRGQQLLQRLTLGKRGIFAGQFGELSRAEHRRIDLDDEVVAGGVRAIERGGQWQHGGPQHVQRTADVDGRAGVLDAPQHRWPGAVIQVQAAAEGNAEFQFPVVDAHQFAGGGKQFCRAERFTVAQRQHNGRHSAGNLSPRDAGGVFPAGRYRDGQRLVDGQRGVVGKELCHCAIGIGHADTLDRDCRWDGCRGGRGGERRRLRRARADQHETTTDRDRACHWGTLTLRRRTLTAAGWGGRARSRTCIQQARRPMQRAADVAACEIIDSQEAGRCAVRAQPPADGLRRGASARPDT